MGSVLGLRVAVAAELLLGGLARIFVQDGKNLGTALGAALGATFGATFGAAFGADFLLVLGYVSVNEVLEPS